MAQDVVIALDVGGTGIKCALVDDTGRVRHSERHTTGRERGPDAVVANVLDIAEGLVRTAGRAGLRPEAVGIAVPGVIDEATGMAVWSANLGFREVPLRGLVAERLGLPAALGHDVRVGGLAEARLGAGRGHRHVLFVAIGTGIAAAHVVDGHVLTGAHGAAGELGHVVVRAGGPACGCGLRGCLEANASATAVARRYAERVGSPAEGGLGAAPAESLLGADRVVALAAAGDPPAASIWRETIDALADGLLTGLALFDPEVVVVGGGLAEAGDGLLTPLRAALRERLTFHREPVLMRAALGDEAGCLGAGLIARDALATSRDALTREIS
jgi:glucokinase